MPLRLKSGRQNKREKKILSRRCCDAGVWTKFVRMFLFLYNRLKRTTQEVARGRERIRARIWAPLRTRWRPLRTRWHDWPVTTTTTERVLDLLSRSLRLWSHESRRANENTSTLAPVFSRASCFPISAGVCIYKMSVHPPARRRGNAYNRQQCVLSTW